MTRLDPFSQTLVAFLSLVGIVPSPLPAVTEGAARLPSLECVVAVRNARISSSRKDVAAAEAAFETAMAMPGCELPALTGYLQSAPEMAVAVERTAALRGRLIERLSDPTSDLPPGLLGQLANFAVVANDRAADESLLGALGRRRAAAEASSRPLPRTELLEAYEIEARVYQRLGRLEEARQAMGRLLELSPSHAARWEAMLFDLTHQRWKTAAELLSSMIAEDDAPLAVRYFYVTSLAHLGRYEEMLVQLEKLAPPLPGQTPEVAKSPEPAELRLPTAGWVPSLVGGGTAGFVDLLVRAAWALRDAGRDPEAANLFRRVVAYDPGHQEALAALLHLYGTAEERANAAASAAVRRQGETDPVRLFEEGSDLLGAGDLEGAFPLLQRAAPQLEAGPYAEPAWYNLGTAAFRLQKWQEAVKAFEQAIAVNPERSESHFKLGVARYHLGKCSEVIPALRRALELAPTKRDAHGFLAACYRSLGDAAAAAREDALSGSSN